MKKAFARTENVTRFLSGISQVKRRGAAEACLMVVDGDPGLGKTYIAQWWATQNYAPYLRAKAEWTPNWLLRELLGEIASVLETPIPIEHSYERKYTRTLEQLNYLADAAEREKRSLAVVVDEVDHIARREKLLECLRDITDILEIPFILVGMGRIRPALTRYPQIESRVTKTVNFKPLSKADVVLLAETLCEVEVGEDLLEFVTTASKGYAREAKEALAVIERFGKRNNPQGCVRLKHMAGKLLFNDRKTSKPVIVKEEL